MKKYFHLYRPFLLFLTTFFGIYLVATFFYQSYLNSFIGQTYKIDGFTTLVAQQSHFILTFFDKNAQTMVSKNDVSMLLFYKNTNVSKVVEGCNAMSIIILFVSFIIAFAGKLKSTVLFAFFGIIVIHVVNVLRIAVLSVMFYEFPRYKSILHGIVFPFIIYGIVFILWIIWTNKFSNYASKAIAK